MMHPVKSIYAELVCMAKFPSINQIFPITLMAALVQLRQRTQAGHLCACVRGRLQGSINEGICMTLDCACADGNIVLCFHSVSILFLGLRRASLR